MIRILLNFIDFERFPLYIRKKKLYNNREYRCQGACHGEITIYFFGYLEIYIEKNIKLISRTIVLASG